MRYATIILLVLIIFNIDLYSLEFRSGGENGEFWKVGDIVNIKFDKNKFDNEVKVLLWEGNKSNFTNLEITNINKGEIKCYLPLNITPGKYFKIRVVDSKNCNNFIQSNCFFEIYSNNYISKYEINSIKYNELELFPNPASDIVTIKLNENIQEIVLSTIEGEILNLKNFEVNGNRLNIESLSNGMYILIIKTETNTYMKKLLKQK